MRAESFGPINRLIFTDFYRFFGLSWETSTFKNYHPGDSKHSGSRRIEFSSKSTTSSQLDLGEEVLWIGLLVNFRLSTRGLPEGKFERMLAYLRLLAEADEVLSRKEVGAGQGLMIWIAQTFPQLRSYLRIFYEVVALPRATDVTLTREQLHLLVNSLDEVK